MLGDTPWRIGFTLYPLGFNLFVLLVTCHALLFTFCKMAERKIRVLVAKPGLDGHDHGAKFLAQVDHSERSHSQRPLRALRLCGAS